VKLNLDLSKIRRKQLAIIAIAVVAVAVVGVIFWPNKEASSEKPVTYSTDRPSEEKPNKNTYKWTGAADEPKYIVLPTIKAEGFVQKVGVDQNKQIAVPTNIHLAGWFIDTVKPGAKGLSILDGHVNGRVNNGIFKDLAKVKKADEFTVELGDGTIKKYKVLDITTLPTKESVNVLFSQNPKVKSQLNLITCGGKFDAKTQQYDSRVIVSAELIG
jgi:LPXTG-site transpeptidase (sortase) family protein